LSSQQQLEEGKQGSLKQNEELDLSASMREDNMNPYDDEEEKKE
jgi:hypothetical protein